MRSQRQGRRRALEEDHDHDVENDDTSRVGKESNSDEDGDGDVGITPFSKHGILSGVVGPAAPTFHTNANTNTRKRGLVDVRSTNSNSIQHDNSPSFIGRKRDPLKLKNARNDIDAGIDHNLMPHPLFSSGENNNDITF